MPHHLAVRLLIAALAAGSMLRASPAFAQSSTPPSNALVLRVDPPGAPSDWFRGGLTITGVAVDCASMQPATRVAAYRGTETDDYLADVSMEVSKNLQTYCSNGTGAANMGFRLILDTRRLNDGHNTLTFAAQYDTGTPEATRSASFDINVNNVTWIWGRSQEGRPGRRFAVTARPVRWTPCRPLTRLPRTSPSRL